MGGKGDKPRGSGEPGHWDAMAEMEQRGLRSMLQLEGPAKLTTGGPRRWPKERAVRCASSTALSSGGSAEKGGVLPTRGRSMTARIDNTVRNDGRRVRRLVGGEPRKLTRVAGGGVRDARACPNSMAWGGAQQKRQTSDGRRSCWARWWATVVSVLSSN